MRRLYGMAAVAAFGVAVCLPIGTAAASGTPGGDGIETPPGLSDTCRQLFLAWGAKDVDARDFADECLEPLAAPFEFEFPVTDSASSVAGPATRCWGYAEKPWRSTVVVGAIGYGAWVSCDGAMASLYLRAELQLKRVLQNWGTISQAESLSAGNSFASTTGTSPCADTYVFSGDKFRTYAFASGINSAGQLGTPPYDEGLSGEVSGTDLCIL